MTKTQLLQTIASETETDKRTAAFFLDAITNIAYREVKKSGEFVLPDKPGLGVELDVATCRAHPYVRNTFPSLWDRRWIEQFTSKR